MNDEIDNLMFEHLFGMEVCYEEADIVTLKFKVLNINLCNNNNEIDILLIK